MNDLPLYKCHKLVRAARITACEKHEDGSISLALDTGNVHRVAAERARSFFRGSDDDLGYLVQYPKEGTGFLEYYVGYESWSPSVAFEEGYTLVPESPE